MPLVGTKIFGTAPPAEKPRKYKPFHNLTSG